MKKPNLQDLRKLDPRIRINLRYATTDNFMKKKVYSSNRCLLRGEVAERLLRVEHKLRQKGYGLLIWDAYRPFSVQKILWETVPNERYVARPVEEKGKILSGSIHNRGAAVDLTLVDSNGEELPMPSLFDEFNEKAHRDFESSDAVLTRNRDRLEEAMVSEGFLPLPHEWWHFNDPLWESFPLLDIPL